MVHQRNSTRKMSAAAVQSSSAAPAPAVAAPAPSAAAAGSGNKSRTTRGATKTTTAASTVASTTASTASASSSSKAPRKAAAATTPAVAAAKAVTKAKASSSKSGAKGRSATAAAGPTTKSASEKRKAASTAAKKSSGRKNGASTTAAKKLVEGAETVRGKNYGVNNDGHAYRTFKLVTLNGENVEDKDHTAKMMPKKALADYTAEELQKLVLCPRNAASKIFTALCQAMKKENKPIPDKYECEICMKETTRNSSHRPFYYRITRDVKPNDYWVKDKDGVEKKISTKYSNFITAIPRTQVKNVTAQQAVAAE